MLTLSLLDNHIMGQEIQLLMHITMDSQVYGSNATVDAQFQLCMALVPANISFLEIS